MSRSKNPEAYPAVAVATPLFHGLTQAEAKAMLGKSGITVSHFEKGETIYAPDAYVRSIGFLTAGRASVMKAGGEAGMLMSVLHSGELFGAATLFAGADAYVASIRALESTWAVMIPEPVLLYMMREDFRIAENYMAYLTQRIRFLSGRIDGFAQDGSADRLLIYIKKNAQDGVFIPEGGMRALSDALCIGRTTLYRGLDSLSQKGLIRREGKAIVLLKEDI